MDVAVLQTAMQVTDAFEPAAKRIKVTHEPASLLRLEPVSARLPALEPAAPDYALFATLSGHTKGVSSVKISPSGQHLISASADSQLLLYSLESATFIRPFQGHTAGLNDVAWSPDSHTVASASDDQTVRIWSVDTGQVTRIFRGHTSYVFCLDWNPQGTVLVSGSFDESMKMWDVKKAKLLRSIPAHGDPISAVQYNRDGTMIVSSSHDGLMFVFLPSFPGCLRLMCRVK